MARLGSTFKGNPSTNAAGRFALAREHWIARGKRDAVPEPDGELAEVLRAWYGDRWRELSRKRTLAWGHHGGKNPPATCPCEHCKRERTFFKVACEAHFTRVMGARKSFN